MATSWIEHKGKKILYIDYRGSKNDDELLKILQEQIGILKGSSSKILALSNFTNVFLSSKFMDEVKKAGKEIGTIKLERSALIGVEGIKNILLSSYLLFTGDKNTKPFGSENEAKDWLVS
jgi:hypothetical protein